MILTCFRIFYLEIGGKACFFRFPEARPRSPAGRRGRERLPENRRKSHIGRSGKGDGLAKKKYNKVRRPYLALQGGGNWLENKRLQIALRPSEIGCR